MWVGHLCSHVEPEVFVIVNVGVSQSDQRPPTSHKCLLQQDGFQSWIQALLQLESQHSEAEKFKHERHNESEQIQSVHYDSAKLNRLEEGVVNYTELDCTNRKSKIYLHCSIYFALKKHICVT